MNHTILFLTLSLAPVLTTAAVAAEPDWSQSARIPDGGDRANIYDLPADEWRAAVLAGRRHALSYPVTVSGIVIPYRPVKALLENRRNLMTRLLGDAAARLAGINTMDDLFARVGLKPYPREDGDFGLPFPAASDGLRPVDRMGVTLQTRGGATVFTFGCATCHVGQLFGQPVFGLTNRTTRANDFFLAGETQLARVEPSLFRFVTGASAAETQVLRDTRARLQWATTRAPAALGLDTSLAQVGLSLARRAEDAYATMTAASARHPRPNVLDTLVADSKPAVWWTLKYKTRWLSDGAVLSGNPVHTNFLWNELGRATDLRVLESWLAANQLVVRDLTAAVFATEAPRYTAFFPEASRDLARAKRGKTVFDARCARCHGSYRKAWEDPDALGDADPFATTKVSYHARTPVVDVGTDPGRRQGMAGFAQRLNELAISRAMGTTVAVQTGYVPPPLVGIWARWPYFHNNSAPTLCAVLTRAADRPVLYYTGEPLDPATDFDAACNGYPAADAAPLAWRRKETLFDSSKPGLSRRGHDEGIFLDRGRELLTPDDKGAVIEFLKTL